jgi:hypothetical protein
MAERATRRRLWIGRLRSVALALGVNLALLAGLDLMLVKLDLLSPPFTYGLEGVGFGYAGVRRSSDFGVVTPGAGEAVTIAMVGDSHSQLAFDGRPLESHEFVLERRLRAAGIPALMISAGRGRYSPLQEYLLFKLAIEEPYHPRLLVMNVYSGNDFYDMLRPDDRPHYLRDSAGGIAIEDPEWITFVNPSTRRWIERSRLLWAVDELSSRLGYPRVVTRLRMLGAAARQPGHTTAETVRYLSDLRASQEPRLGYPAALAAQILNQALFFKHFPEAVDESLVFMRELLETARAENPDLTLVMSAIPSAALVDAMPAEVRGLWEDTLDRTGLSNDWVAGLEDGLVDRLEAAAVDAGWIFIDLRPCLRGRAVEGELYSPFDLHISAVASRLIGECQAERLLAAGAAAGLGDSSTAPLVELRKGP